MTGQAQLFEQNDDMRRVLKDLPDADLEYRPDFLPAAAATRLFAELRDSLAWQADHVQLFGRRHPIPRRHQWYGDAGAVYRWSGLTMQPRSWTPALADVLDQVCAVAAAPFNAVLANYYRDGEDCMGWHADDEPELGPEPVIASLSLGAARDFVLRYRERQAGIANVALPLAHGSLLIMRGATQRHWQHALPRRRRVHEPRINLTFRRIIRRE